jgi:hypothetical protein
MQDEQTSNEREDTTTMKTLLRIRSDLAQSSWNVDATDMDSFSKSYRMPDSTFSSAVSLAKLYSNHFDLHPPRLSNRVMSLPRLRRPKTA